ncbi:CD225/dispanin family protein [Coleofasciculus sp. H7-2]|uniref:CD225/dispanin family protein n=1 Tax=Coleofasciculus sp. H7-2 TaxID=3351545 RepID=UPI00366FFB9E
MTQTNLLELARAGDVRAIASLINHQLQPKGITAKATLKDDCLQIMLESAQVPNQQALVTFIRKWITQLGVECIKRVKVYGRLTGDEFPSWSQDFEATSVGNNAQSETSIPSTKNSVSENSKTSTNQDNLKIIASPRIQFQSKTSCPRTYLVPSILVTLFACIPAGLVGISFASQVKSKYQQGDYDSALSASKKAKISCIIGVSIGGFIFVTAFVHGFRQGFQKSIQRQVATRQQSIAPYVPPAVISHPSEYLPPIETYLETNPVHNALSQLDGHAYLMGADNVFLGIISSDRINEKSICNQVGEFGSRVTSKSVWNRVGDYGSRISDTSAYKTNTNQPPIIVNENNEIIGFLTVNTRIKGAVDPDFLHAAMCQQ